VKHETEYGTGFVAGDLAGSAFTAATRRPISVELSAAKLQPAENCLHCAHLQEQVERERRKQDRLARKYLESQKRYRRLTLLRTAAEQMLAPQPRLRIYGAIQELVCNLTGAEQVGVFVFDQLSCNLNLVSSSGIDVERFCNVPLGSSLIGRTAATGTVFLARESEIETTQFWAADIEDELSACVPLRYSGVLLGAVAIFGQHGGNKSFGEEDRELFDAISKWMSFALYCTAMGWVTG
jgi:GAF domain